MVVPCSSVNGSNQALSLSVFEAGQADAPTHDPSSQHQRSNRGEAGCKPDPNADTFPIAREGQPGTDSEPDHPIADKREQERPARIVQAAQHAGPDHLRAVDQLESGGDSEKA